jgi:hemoglobin
MMKKFLGVVCLLAFASVALAADAPMAKPSLYKRLGGYDAIAAVCDDFIGRLAADKQIAPFLAGHSQDSLKKLRQNLVDLVCSASGGPCYYVGRDMKTAHAGMGITEAQWDSSVADLVASLDHFKVGATEKDELLGAVSSFKKDIVEKPAMK